MAAGRYDAVAPAANRYVKAGGRRDSGRGSWSVSSGRPPWSGSGTAGATAALLARPTGRRCSRPAGPRGVASVATSSFPPRASSCPRPVGPGRAGVARSRHARLAATNTHDAFVRRYRRQRLPPGTRHRPAASSFLVLETGSGREGDPQVEPAVPSREGGDAAVMAVRVWLSRSCWGSPTWLVESPVRAHRGRATVVSKAYRRSNRDDGSG